MIWTKSFCVKLPMMENRSKFQIGLWNKFQLSEIILKNLLVQCVFKIIKKADKSHDIGRSLFAPLM